MQINKNTQDTDEILLEKHALLDVLFADKLWDKPYIRNPFPYLQEDYTTMKPSDRSNIAQAYAVNVRQYTSQAKTSLKSN